MILNAVLFGVGIVIIIIDLWILHNRHEKYNSDAWLWIVIVLTIIATALVCYSAAMFNYEFMRSAAG